MTWRVEHADCIEAMRELDEASIDAVVCDPPYGLEFMGKEWDRLWNEGGDDFSEGKKWGKRPAGSRPRYNQNRKCRRCGRWDRDKNPCRCDDPNWEPPKAPSMGNQIKFSQKMQEWHHAWATEALRVLKPGGHLLAFGGTRTYHRLACAVEDAGFEIRDSLIWLYGSGFPKSLDVSKAIDRRRNDNHEPIVVARKPLTGTVAANVLEHGTGAVNVDGCRVEFEAGIQPKKRTGHCVGLDGATFSNRQSPGPRADEYTGAGRWPANVTLSHLPECGCAPDDESTVGYIEWWDGPEFNARYYRHPGCREWVVPRDDCPRPTGTRECDACARELPVRPAPDPPRHAYTERCGGDGVIRFNPSKSVPLDPQLEDEAKCPGCEDCTSPGPCAPGCPVAELDRQSGERRSAGEYVKGSGAQGDKDGAASIPIDGLTSATYSDTGGASRFFYVAKASRAERNAGLEGFEEREADKLSGGAFLPVQADGGPSYTTQKDRRAQNNHPTVKPMDLMRWLVRLVTPPGGTVLDPFTGSGTTGIACVLEDFDFIGIEREAEYVEIAKARIAHWASQPKQLELT